MTRVVRRENESIESLLKRFRGTVSRDKIFLEIRKHSRFRSNAEQRRRRHRKSRAYQKRKTMRQANRETSPEGTTVPYTPIRARNSEP